jgi:hypothetical protein
MCSLLVCLFSLHLLSLHFIVQLIFWSGSVRSVLDSQFVYLLLVLSRQVFTNGAELWLGGEAAFEALCRIPAGLAPDRGLPIQAALVRCFSMVIAFPCLLCLLSLQLLFFLLLFLCLFSY